MAHIFMLAEDCLNAIYAVRVMPQGVHECYSLYIEQGDQHIERELHLKLLLI